MLSSWLRRARYNGTAVGVAVTVVCAVAASVVGTPAGLLYIGSMAAVAVVYASTSRLSSLLELALVAYLTAPLVRRVVDYTDGYHATSPVLATGALVALAGLVRAPVRNLRGRAACALGLALLSLGYAATLSMLHGELLPTAVNALKLAAPLLLVVRLVAEPVEIKGLTRALRRSAGVLLPAVSAYGIYQLVVMPPWDAYWMRSAATTIGVIGSPEPYAVRVFATAASPAPLAIALVFLLLVSFGVGGWVQVPGQMLGLACLAVTLVRFAWLVLLLAVLLSAVTRLGPKVAARLAVAAPLLCGAAAVASPSATAGFLTRVSTTVGAGSSDYSLAQRLAFQVQAIPEALGNVVGEGLAATGAAVRLGGPTASRYANIDSGFADSLVTMGAVFGIVFLASIFVLACGSWSRVEPGGLGDALRVFAMTAPLQLAFGTIGDHAVITICLVAAMAGAKAGDLPVRLPVRREFALQASGEGGGP